MSKKKEGFYLREVNGDVYLYLYQNGILSVYSNVMSLRDNDDIYHANSHITEHWGWMLSAYMDFPTRCPLQYLEGL